MVRFLWLCQLKKNNDPRFDEVARQTGIYLQNPYWTGISIVRFANQMEKI